MQEIAESVFRDNIKKLCRVVACRVIGDESTYNRFLSRQCLNGNEGALSLSESIRMIENIHRDLHAAVVYFNNNGQSRLCRIIREMQTAPSMDFGKCNIWSVCALSGKVGSDFIILRGHEVHMLVDAKYTGFLQCVWILWHITDIETTRLERYMGDMQTSVSIKAVIDQFIHSDAYVSDEETALYFAAYEHVRSTLALAMEHMTVVHNSVPRRGPDITSSS